MLLAPATLAWQQQQQHSIVSPDASAGLQHVNATSGSTSDGIVSVIQLPRQQRRAFGLNDTRHAAQQGRVALVQAMRSQPRHLTVPRRGTRDAPRQKNPVRMMIRRLREWFGTPLTVTFLHINDHHSHITDAELSLNVSSMAGGSSSVLSNVSAVRVKYGGFARLVTLMQQLEASSTNVLKFHAGDAITGTIWYSLFKGENDAEVMGRICFDAFALGNHEFDDGDGNLADFLQKLKETGCNTSVLAANVKPGPTSPLGTNSTGYLKPYKIFMVDSQQVGVIGIDISGKTMQSSNPDEGTVLLNELSTTQKYVDELTAQGVNKIVLLSHIGLDRDVELAAALRGVDVIVGGDSHSLMGDAASLASVGVPKAPAANYPQKVVDLDGNPVCIVQAWEYAHAVGKLVVQFDASGHVASCSGTPVFPLAERAGWWDDAANATLSVAQADAVAAALPATLAVEVAEDAATRQLVEKTAEHIVELTHEVIATFSSPYCFDRMPGQGRSTLCNGEATYDRGGAACNLVARSALVQAKTADFSIQNAGGCRTDIATGDFTINDAYTMLPFENTLLTVQLNGSQVVQALEDALGGTLDHGGSDGAYPYASGLRYAINTTRSAGSRLFDVEVNSQLKGEWLPLLQNQTYTVVLNSYIADGKDGWLFLGTIPDSAKVDTFTSYTQGFIDYLKKLPANIGPLPADEYSTQQYIDPNGCDHSSSPECGAWTYDAKMWITDTIFEAQRELGANVPAGKQGQSGHGAQHGHAQERRAKRHTQTRLAMPYHPLRLEARRLRM